MGRKLVTVRTDCDLAGQVDGWPALDSLALREVDREGLLAFYNRFGFQELAQGTRRSTARRRAAAARPAEPQAEVAPEETLPREYETILDWARFEHWLQRLQQADLVAVDTETDSLEPMRARIVGISFAVEPGRAAYIPLTHDYPGVVEQLPLAEVLARLKPWLEDPAHPEAGTEHQVRQPCVRQPGHRGAGFQARHDAAELRAGCAPHAQPGSVGRAPPEPQRPELRGRLRQGRQADPVRPGRTAEGDRVFGRRQRDDAGVAPALVAADRRQRRDCAPSTKPSRCRSRRCSRGSSATAC